MGRLAGLALSILLLGACGSGNQSIAGKFPFDVASGAWLADQSVIAYTLPVPPDDANFGNGGVGVYLYGGTEPTGKVFAIQLSTGTETEVGFAAGETPAALNDGHADWTSFGSGEFWPAT